MFFCSNFGMTVNFMQWFLITSWLHYWELPKTLNFLRIKHREMLQNKIRPVCQYVKIAYPLLLLSITRNYQYFDIPNCSNYVASHFSISHQLQEDPAIHFPTGKQSKSRMCFILHRNRQARWFAFSIVRTTPLSSTRFKPQSGFIHTNSNRLEAVIPGVWVERWCLVQTLANSFQSYSNNACTTNRKSETFSSERENLFVKLADAVYIFVRSSLIATFNNVCYG